MKKTYLIGVLVIAILAGVLIGQSQGFVLAKNEGEEVKTVNKLEKEEEKDIEESEEIEIILDEEVDLEELRKEELKEEKTEVITRDLSEKELFERQMELAREEINLALKKNIITEEQGREELEYIDYLEENYDREFAPDYDEDYYNRREYGHHGGGIHHRDGSCRSLDGDRIFNDYGWGHHNSGCRRY